MDLWKTLVKSPCYSLLFCVKAAQINIYTLKTTIDQITVDDKSNCAATYQNTSKTQAKIKYPRTP